MVAIICTLIICVTVLASIVLIKQTLISIYTPAQQHAVYTEEDIKKMEEEAEKDKIPNFQDVIDAINKEFLGVELYPSEERPALLHHH